MIIKSFSRINGGGGGTNLISTLKLYMEVILHGC